VNGVSAVEWQRLGVPDFARLFGTSPSEMPDDCQSLIGAGDFRFRRLTAQERETVLGDVLRTIDSDQFDVAGPSRREKWERGWAENLQGLRDGEDLAELVPRYIRPGQPLRLQQDYVMPLDARFELKWFEVFRTWLFRTYFEPADVVYEFGCGSGFNLAELARLYPTKEYYGLDWARASTEIVNELGERFGWRMRGQPFDFFAPDRSVKIRDNAVVFTIGALEQTGTNHDAFLEYLLESEPALCVHVEPIIEWYDADHPIDAAAIRFHRRRGYWSGFPEKLRALEKDGRVRILKTQRAHFGSLYIEGYSQLIWMPVR
jgi:SAM-dependent methyltransferase